MSFIELPSVENQCRMGGNLAFSIDNALMLATISRYGHEVAETVQFSVLRSHQEQMFIEGLRKLGLDKETSDAIRCAKYHVLSNFLGGLRVRYGEMSGKAWIIYDSPYWIDSPWSPGIAAVAIRPEMLISTMSAWHGNNGKLLNNPQLAYVQTSLVARGDACDAGYFVELDHELSDSEKFQLRFDEGIPEQLELSPPSLDEKYWPIERQAKAWRNFSVAYVGGRLYWMRQILGEEKTVELLEHAFRITILQNRERILELFRISGPAAPIRAAALWCACHLAWGDEIRQTPADENNRAFVVERSRMHEVGEFSPPAESFPRSFEAAIDRAWQTVIEYDSPGVQFRSSGSVSTPEDPWRVEIRHKQSRK